MAPRETENNAYAKFGVTKKEHYGMLWYFLEWSIREKYSLYKLVKNGQTIQGLCSKLKHRDNTNILLNITIVERTCYSLRS